MQNLSLFQFCILDLIQDIFKGKSHGLFFAGGPNAGKTHTILGSMADPGIVFNFVTVLFNTISLQEKVCKVYISIF